MDHGQTSSQLKLLLKTTKSKLNYKLTKNRKISENKLIYEIIPEIKQLSVIYGSKKFERNLEILKLNLSNLIRSDRITDVYEDLDSEIIILENSLPQIIKMIDSRLIDLKNENFNKNYKTSKLDQSPSSSWSFLGFTFTSNQRKIPLQGESVYKDDPYIDADKKKNENENENGGKDENEDEGQQKQQKILIEKLDRTTKVIRNILAADSYLNDDIIELKKLSTILAKSVDKDKILDSSNLLLTKDSRDNLDLQDRIYIEIVRKLRGDDEESIVNDYISELCDIYKIDLFNEGKYHSDSENNLSDDSSNDKIGKNPTKKQHNDLNDLNDLKKRFEALKKN